MCDSTKSSDVRSLDEIFLSTYFLAGVSKTAWFNISALFGALSPRNPASEQVTVVQAKLRFCLAHHMLAPPPSMLAYLGGTIL